LHCYDVECYGVNQMHIVNLNYVNILEELMPCLGAYFSKKKMPNLLLQFQSEIFFSLYKLYV